MADDTTLRLLERINRLESESVRMMPGKITQVSPLKVSYNGTTAGAVTVTTASFTVGQNVNVLFLPFSKPVVLPII